MQRNEVRSRGRFFDKRSSSVLKKTILSIYNVVQCPPVGRFLKGCRRRSWRSVELRREVRREMGSCVSSHEEDAVFDATRKRRQSSMGVGMGVAMMMQQAGMMVGQAAASQDHAAIHAEMRKAKAEGRTVTVLNGGVYIDYHLVGRVPPHFDPHSA